MMPRTRTLIACAAAPPLWARTRHRRARPWRRAQRSAGDRDRIPGQNQDVVLGPQPNPDAAHPDAQAAGRSTVPYPTT